MPCAIKVRGKFLVLAAIFHVLITLGLFTVGRLGLAPARVDRFGIAEFALDSRNHAAHAELLAGALKRGEIGAWFRDRQPLHIKLFSISILLSAPLLGNNILAAEPLNLLLYLVIIEATFRLGLVIGGSRGARVAAFLVAVWPSVVLHSCQFLRDPLIIIAVAALISVLVLLLKKKLKWLQAAYATAIGALMVWVIWNSKPEMWLVILAVNCVATAIFVIRMIDKRRLFVVNLVAVILLNVVPFVMPRPALGVVSADWSVRPESQSASLWSRISQARDKFIKENEDSGSTIDKDVTFNTPNEILRYVPRALEIGYLAPFPSMWVRTGNNVGLAGRLLSGAEMMLTYLLEILALIYLWKTRRRAGTWFVALATLIGMLAIGLVVVNVGTLYRMRYPFWVPIVVMGTAMLVRLPLPQRFAGIRIFRPRVMS